MGGKSILLGNITTTWKNYTILAIEVRKCLATSNIISQTIFTCMMAYIHIYNFIKYQKQNIVNNGLDFEVNNR